MLHLGAAKVALGQSHDDRAGGDLGPQCRFGRSRGVKPRRATDERTPVANNGGPNKARPVSSNSGHHLGGTGPGPPVLLRDQQTRKSEATPYPPRGRGRIRVPDQPIGGSSTRVRAVPGSDGWNWRNSSCSGLYRRVMVSSASSRASYPAQPSDNIVIQVIYLKPSHDLRRARTNHG